MKELDVNENDKTDEKPGKQHERVQNDKELENLEQDQEKLQTVSDQAVYEMVMYLPLDDLSIEEGYTVSDIISRARNEADNGNDNIDLDILKTLEAIDVNSPCLDATISNMSYNSDYSADELVNDPDTLFAAVFTLNGESSINFSGTPSKAWMDNSDMLDGVPGQPYTVNGNTWYYLSDIDIATLEYIESLDKEELEQFIVSGHSKGGHEAFLVALVYPERVSECYGFDAPSISPEMWDELRRYYSEGELQSIRDKINAVNVENDPVHTFGWTEENGYVANNVYTIQGSSECDTNIIASHYIQSLFSYDKYGNLQLNQALTKEGPLAEFMKVVSDYTMDLTPEERRAVTATIMSICQAALGKTSPVNFTLQELIQTVGDWNNGGAKLLWILNEALNTDEGAAVIKYFDTPVSPILSFAKDHPLITTIITSIVAPELPVIDLLYKLSIIADAILIIEDIGNAIMNATADFFNNAKEFLGMVVNGIDCFFNQLVQTANGLSTVVKIEIHKAGLQTMDFEKLIRHETDKEIRNRMLIFNYQMKGHIDSLRYNTVRIQTITTGIARSAQELFRVLSEILSHGFEKYKMDTSNIHDKHETDLKEVRERMVKMLDDANARNMQLVISIQENITNAVQKDQAILKNMIEQVKVGMNDAPKQVKADAVEKVQELTGVLSDTLEMCREASITGVDSIKDSVYNGLSLMTDSVLSMDGWLKEKTGTAIASVRNTIKGDMIGRVGIDYVMVQRACVQIGEFSDDAMHLERMIDSILSDLSSLSYTSVSTAQLVDAKSQITRQRNYMNTHSDDLIAYENACRKTEEGFVAALYSFY